jgi:hypothetical protein
MWLIICICCQLYFVHGTVCRIIVLNFPIAVLFVSKISFLSLGCSVGLSLFYCIFRVIILYRSTMYVVIEIIRSCNRHTASLFSSLVLTGSVNTRINFKALERIRKKLVMVIWYMKKA